jgi:hypothetical protein
MRTDRDSISMRGRGEGGRSVLKDNQQRSFLMEENFIQNEQEACVYTTVSVDRRLDHGSHDASAAASFMKSCGAEVLPFQSVPDSVSLGAWKGETFGTNKSIGGN